MSENRASIQSVSEGGEEAASKAVSGLEADRLLASDPAAAEARARTFLIEHPGHLSALLLLGAALRRQGDFAGARAVLEPLAQSAPALILAHYELGLALGELGEHAEAVRVLAIAIDLVPNFAQAWFALAEQFDLMQHSAPANPHLQEARHAIRGRPPARA